MPETPTREGAWTEGEKAFLMYQIMQQWKPEKATVNWDNINIPGRTKKALQNTYAKVMGDMLKKVAEYQEGGGTAAPVTPTPRKRAAKKKGKDADADNDNTDADEDAGPAKKKRATKKAAAKKNPISHEDEVVEAESITAKNGAGTDDDKAEAKPTAKAKRPPRKKATPKMKKEASPVSPFSPPPEGLHAMDEDLHLFAAADNEHADTDNYAMGCM